MQIYLNLESRDGTPVRVPRFQYQEDTMQVPRGRYSILSELWHRNVTAAEAVVYLALNHQSYWDTGLTWCIATRELARSLGVGMSVRYCRSVLASLENKGWIVCLPLEKKRRRYKLVHHQCDAEDVPVDNDGKPLKFAVSRGIGGPFERLEAGNISWKACLLWVVYKLHSDWNTGITEAYSIDVLAKLCRVKRNTVCDLLKELENAEMLHRLSAARQRSMFQLYPMPDPVSMKRRKQKPTFTKAYDVTTDGVYWYSDNRQYRCHRETLVIERRQGKGKWSALRDRERWTMPAAIQRDFDRVAETKAAILGMGMDANVVSDSAQKVAT